VAGSPSDGFQCGLSPHRKGSCRTEGWCSVETPKQNPTSIIEICTPGPPPCPSNAGTGWDVETALDVQYAHAMAPNAQIVVAEFTNDPRQDGAEQQATQYLLDDYGGGEVSNSWGHNGGEVSAVSATASSRGTITSSRMESCFSPRPATTTWERNIPAFRLMSFRPGHQHRARRRRQLHRRKLLERQWRRHQRVRASAAIRALPHQQNGYHARHTRLGLRC